jgi:two-component system, NarL family, nitrate/nitrite response regulator NarL
VSTESAILEIHKPDILILDISIPGGGIAALQAIRNLDQNSKTLMLTVSDDEADVFNSLNLGAHGYVLKGIGGTELVNALRAVYVDGYYLSPNLGAKLLTDIGRNKQASKAQGVDSLNERDEKIFALVGHGRSNREIGAELNLAEKTIKHYMTGLFKKFQVRSRTELAILAQKRKVGSAEKIRPQNGKPPSA